MKTNRFRDRSFNAIIISVFMLGASLYSCIAKAQDLTMSEYQDQMRNSGGKIHLAANLNPDAKAISINSTVNSPYEELKPATAPLGRRLYFSRSQHPANTGGETDLEDIWYTEFDSTVSVWSEPIRLPGNLNNAGPNFICGVSLTGDTIMLGNTYTRKGVMRAGLSYSVNKNGRWSDPITIKVRKNYNISEHASFHVALKAGVIISAVERFESMGGRDLFVSFWNGIEASEPVSMGAIINTEFEESSPYLSCDTKTLYFASKGHQGFGGYDIYSTKRLDDSWTNWSTPENLGPAVNGALDDEFFAISHCQKFAFFSKQVSVHNVDLYKIRMDDLFTQPRSAVVEKENTPTVTDKSPSALAKL